MASKARHSAAVYDHASTRGAVVSIMERCGFLADLVVGPPGELVDRTRSQSYELLVFDLATAGTYGLAIVRELRVALPTCAVVPLAPFDGLREYAMEAGAYDLVEKEDLRDLVRCLRRLATELDARGSAVAV